MKPKKITMGLTGQRQKAETFSQRVSLLLPAALLFLGLWGMAQVLWNLTPAWSILGLWAVAVVLLPSWQRGWQRWLLMALCLAALVVCVAAREPLTDGLAALADGVNTLLTQKTGYYYFPYETGGIHPLTKGLLALTLGGLTGVSVRCLRGAAHLLWGLGVLLVYLLVDLQAGFWLGLYLAGMLLLVVRLSAGAGKPLAAAALLLGVLGGIWIWVGPALAWEGAGDALSARIHALRYEAAPNPMPEGRLEHLGPFSPGQEPALEITMDAWSPLYIRGFVGGTYTEQGWKRTDPETLAERAGQFYVLQRDCFSPAAQMGAAARWLGTQEQTAFSLQVLNACKAEAYVPYGADTLQTDARALLGEGYSPGEALSGAVYCVGDSYLMQAELAAGNSGGAYTDGEAVYRDWVYEEFLAVPEETYRLLSQQFTLPSEAMTTTQARREVQSLLDACLTYDEAAVMSTGGKPFLEYLLTVNPRGYSVQYATLATLLMRCCGIPARYVEGYLLSGSKIEEAEPGQTLVLTQSDSHAWAEIYLDGVGWIPFDTTPNHKNEVVYAMPPGGGSQETDQMSQVGQPLAQTQQEIQIQQEGREETRTDADGWTLWPLWILPALALLLLVLRTVLLRRRLRRRVAAFSTGEIRAASLDCLVYTGELLTDAGLSRRNVPLTHRGAEIAALLAPVREENVQAVLALAAELRFSNHVVTEESRKQALDAMQAVLSGWKRKMPWYRQIRGRWIQCIIL